MFSNNSLAVLFSPTQNSFHIQTITDMLEDNRDIFKANITEAYIVLSIVNERHEADAVISHFKNIKKTLLNNDRDPSTSNYFKEIGRSDK
jgi:hypothetical protein